MNSIIASKTAIKASSLTITLNDGSDVTLGYESDVQAQFNPILKKDSSGRETPIGYDVVITWDMMQSDYSALSEVSNYAALGDLVDLTIEGFYVRGSSNDFTLSDVRPVFSPQIRDTNYSPIKCRATKTITLALFNGLFQVSP